MLPVVRDRVGVARTGGGGMGDEASPSVVVVVVAASPKTNWAAPEAAGDCETLIKSDWARRTGDVLDGDGDRRCGEEGGEKASPAAAAAAFFRPKDARKAFFKNRLEDLEGLPLLVAVFS